jgi:hypothetical protein
MKKLINQIKRLLGMQYDIDAIMALKNSFQGQKFQMVKGKSPKLGKVFDVIDIEPSRNGYFAMLNDGTKLSIDSLNSNFMMLMDEQPLMSMAEIASINEGYTAPAKPETEIAPGLDIPPEIASELSAPKKKSPAELLHGTSPSAPVSQPKQQVTENDLFGMFALESTNLNLTVEVRLPNKSLLKAMYQNSQNQSDFINKLSVYINNSVTADSIKDSLWKMLDPEKKKKLNDKSS